MNRLLFAISCSLAVGFATPALADSAVEGKLCLFSVAERLPRLPGLKVLKASVQPNGTNNSLGKPMRMYSGEIDIEAFGQKATYRFDCPYLPDAQSVFDRGLVMGLAR